MSDSLSSASAGLVDAAAFRAAMGRFATGVAVVVAPTKSGPAGITINSLTSVSLAPPIVLWCLGEDAARAEAFTAAPRWSVSVLGDDQAALAERFAREPDPAAGVDFETLGPGRVPVLTGALAQIACATVDMRPLGDHLVIAGAVEAVAVRSGGALTFFRGAFGALANP